MRALLVVLMLLYESTASASDNELERSAEPKRYRDIPKKISPLEHPHSHVAHRPKNIKAEPRIVGGSDTGPNAYPFFVRVDTSGYPYCGGSLVAPDVVLTAGHCFTSDDELSVVVNGYDLYSSGTDLNSDQYARNVNYSIRHPDFNAVTYDNDALLLKLNSPVDTETILLNFNDENPQAGDDLIVMGLGNKMEDGSPASTLQAVTVQAISHELYEANYKQVGLDRVNDDVMLCAGNTVVGMKDVRDAK